MSNQSSDTKPKKLNKSDKKIMEKEYSRKYKQKLCFCEICNCELKQGSKYLHERSIKHISNNNIINQSKNNSSESDIESDDFKNFKINIELCKNSNIQKKQIQNFVKEVGNLMMKYETLNMQTNLITVN